MADSREELMQLMRECGIAVTRENYIDMAWPEAPEEWTVAHEAELPDELQDWSRFKIKGDQIVAD